MTKPTFINKEKLCKIVQKYPTPFHLYDEKGIRAKARALNSAFAWNKGFKEYFAVKATPNPHIMKILMEEGCGFDCSSYTELLLSQPLVSSGEQIMFSSNQTPDEDFLLAHKLGAVINLDDFTHIEVLEKLLEDKGGLPKNISFRYNPGGEFRLKSTDTEIMDTPGDAKYGFTKEQLFEGYKLLKQKGCEKFGIHAFLASNTKTNEYYPTLARILFETVVEIREKTGVSLSYVNLSGGVGVAYKPDEIPNDIYAIGEGVRKAYEEVLASAGMGDVAIYTELGRFILAEHGCLVTRAIREKHIYKEYVGVDACAANLMRPAIYGAYHHITVAGKEKESLTHKYDIAGGLCENNDKFAVDRMLPQIKVGTSDGDLLIIHDTGAHGHAMGYNYNGKLRSAELLLLENPNEDSEGVWVKLIRRAETPDDYFATLP
ncbi:MAG: diaminopimelate decarboxylase [Oscillospiraceae bacterium]|nr:diaminopimelate decarboxylase [Oscillospiraceae bacterium]